MNEIFICSDWHFNHDRSFVWERRGFENVKHMNEAIIERHNSIVRPDDAVLVLGDLMLMDDDGGIECVNRLNGVKTIIIGNHDSAKRCERYYKDINNLNCIKHAENLRIHKLSLYCTHYPTITHNIDDEKKRWQKVWDICGHSHQSNLWDSYDCRHVEMETNNCSPWNIEEIIASIRAHDDGRE